MKEGWVVKELNEIGTVSSGNSINAKVKEQRYHGAANGLPYIATKNVSYNRSINYENGIKVPYEEINSFRIAKKDSILICAEGGSAGRKIGHLSQDVCFVNKLFALATNDDVLSRYVFYWYQNNSFQAEFKSAMTGIIGGVSKGKFQQLKIPVAPFAEQKMIASLLDKAFTSIEQAKANIEKNLLNAKETFQGKLNEIFSQGDDSWKYLALSETLTNQPRNGWSPPAKNHADEGTPVLTLSSVTGFEFKQSKIKYTSAETKEGAHYWVANGDLLITRSNTPELVGHVAIASNIEAPTIYPDLIMKMSVNPDIALTRFIYYQLRSTKLRGLIMGLAKGANPTMKKINKAAVQNLPVSLPTIDQQQKLIEEFDHISVELELIISAYQKKLQTIESLKKSILQKAFSGELT